MRKTLLLVSVLIFSFCGYAQDESIMTIAGESVSKSEFEYVFKKNNTDDKITNEELDEYMELFINYKLKVKEAEELGMDTADSFVKELEGYQDQLAAPYLTNSKVDQELLDQAYSRLKTEVRASHILIKSAEGASPEDTLKAYEMISNLREKIMADEVSFSDAAVKYSEDPSAKSNKGDLGYFTAFQMVYPFENAAYETPVNEVSQIVKTRFGYHILEVTDKRESKGELSVAHIVIVANDQMPEKQQILAKNKIFEIYEKVKGGSDFALLAKQFSDDKGSAQKGGELPMFGPGKMVPEFESVAYSLKEIGDVSEPFKSRFGWHIVKLLNVKALESFDEMKASLEKKIERDSRSQLSKEMFIQDRIKEYGLKEYPKNLTPFYTWLDSSIYKNDWNLDPAWNMSKPLFAIGKTKYSQAQFADYIKMKMNRIKRSNKPKPSLNVIINSNYKLFKDDMVMDYEKARLVDKYPEYRALLQEYHDGILLFELSDKKVWKKATTDSLGLDAFYQERKMDNMWPERVEAVIYKSLEDKVARQVRTWVTDSISNDSIAKLVNTESQLSLVVEEGMYAKADDEVFSKIEWKRGISEIVLLNSQFIFVNITDVLMPSPKSLNEAKGLYISNYQEALEKEWIEELRAKYTVEVNKEVLYSVASE